MRFLVKLMSAIKIVEGLFGAFGMLIELFIMILRPIRRRKNSKVLSKSTLQE
jgi:hypothetical protein